MKFWIKIVGLFLVVSVIAFGVRQWFLTSAREQWVQRYAMVVAGMTVSQVGDAMDRDEDDPDERKTPTGEFERSWTFEERGVRITVVFNQDGLSTYKEFGPSDCGVTPLMEKLVPQKRPN